MNAPLKLNEVKVGMWVSINTKDAPYSYFKYLHGCRGEIESLDHKKGRVQVRVTDKNLNVSWILISPDLLLRRFL
jgi:hypothetical protein